MAKSTAERAREDFRERRLPVVLRERCQRINGDRPEKKHREIVPDRIAEREEMSVTEQ